MNDTVALVGALHQLDEPALRKLIGARLNSVTGIRDWFDLADSLQTPTAIKAGLAHLSRKTLESVQTSLDGPAQAQLTDLGLIVDGRLTREAAHELDAFLATLDDHAAPRDEDSVLDDTRERVAREQALNLTTRLDELLDLIESSGLRAIARGGISAGDASRVTAVLGALPGDLNELVTLLAQAGLVARVEQNWHATELSTWRAHDNTQRWLFLAHAWLESLPRELRDVLATRRAWQENLLHYLAWLYPLDNQWLVADLTRHLATADLLGLRSQGQRTQLGQLLVTGDSDGARKLLSSHIPAHIDKVMLQSDLTIIAPGPLRPDLEAHLRRYAMVESRSLASTYRLNQVLISRAMDAGETAESVESFLAGISSTGIPQPVSYLIADIGKKHGSLRVRATGMSSLITCSEESLTQRVHADANLTILELTRDATNPLRLTSPFEASVVMRNLLGAKYPAVLENETGEIQRWSEPRRGRPVTPASSQVANTTSSLAVVALDALIERLLDTPLPETDSDEQWMTRQIEVAIRVKSSLLVTVALPDGTAREFTIEPRALTNGRLRALDKRSEVERTIPLTSISSVQALA